MIRITPRISLNEHELEFRFVRSSGPGGQNVNKVATAVQLRFNVRESPSLPEPVRERLVRIAGRRLTEDGILILDARRFRSQERNREDAVVRLVELIRKAVAPPKPRRRTGVPRATKARRLSEKRRRSETKKLRGSVPRDSS